MANFDFIGPSSATNNVNGTAAVGLTENGVSFTLTTLAGDGANTASIGSGFVNLVTNGGPETFVLDVTGAGETRFDDAITFSVTSVLGDWTVNGQSVVSGVNSLTGPQAALTFTPSGANTNGELWITSLNATINCFAAYTAISTPDGPRAVQDLAPGDRILRADGGVTTVEWIGKQLVDVRLSHPAKVNPVCISAGAIADNVPARDLWVSQGHAIEIDGLLIDAAALTNGKSVYRVPQMPIDGFSYYHIETRAHELILAEGCPAETYLDNPSRDSFINGAERAGIPPLNEMPLPRISSRRLVPDAILGNLARRAGMPGHAAELDAVA